MQAGGSEVPIIGGIKMKMKRLFCYHCGEDLGESPAKYVFQGDIEACGNSECQRSVRDAYRERDEERRERAEADNYERY